MVPGSVVIQLRNFQGIEVAVEYGVPTERGESARIVMPNGDERVAVLDPDRKNGREECIAFAVNRWRVQQWREAGEQRPI